jgi:hypothetical protein
MAPPFLISGPYVGGGQLEALAALAPGKFRRYSLDRKLGASGRCGEEEHLS